MFRDEQIQEEINKYFFIKDDSHSAKNVYTALIKPEYKKNSCSGTVILKKITHEQSRIYQKLMHIWNPYLETIYGVLESEDEIISINEFIPRPTCFDYSMYDAMYHANPYQGLSLADFIDIDKYASLYGGVPKKHFIDENTALILLFHLCEGLEELQKAGLTHGDISPQNILLTDNPQYLQDTSSINASCPFILKLVDYGTSKAKKKAYHAVTSVIGTQLFAAPEILTYNKPTDRIDIYSLGCILHYMCLGMSPVENGLNESKKLLSPRVFQIIKKCNSDYDTRYRNLKELKKAILRALHIPDTLPKQILRKLPGFRQGKPLNMIIASYTYLSLICSLVAFMRYGMSNDNLQEILFMVTEIAVVFDVFNAKRFFRKYCYWRERRPFIVIPMRIILFLIVIFLYGFIFGS